VSLRASSISERPLSIAAQDKWPRVGRGSKCTAFIASGDRKIFYWQASVSLIKFFTPQGHNGLQHRLDFFGHHSLEFLVLILGKVLAV
jgi:hypothetical protein